MGKMLVMLYFLFYYNYKTAGETVAKQCFIIKVITNGFRTYAVSIHMLRVPAKRTKYQSKYASCFIQANYFLIGCGCTETTGASPSI